MPAAAPGEPLGRRPTFPRASRRPADLPPGPGQRRRQGQRRSVQESCALLTLPMRRRSVSSRTAKQSFAELVFSFFNLDCCKPLTSIEPDKQGVSRVHVRPMVRWLAAILAIVSTSPVQAQTNPAAVERTIPQLDARRTGPPSRLPLPQPQSKAHRSRELSCSARSTSRARQSLVQASLQQARALSCDARRPGRAQQDRCRHHRPLSARRLPALLRCAPRAIG